MHEEKLAKQVAPEHAPDGAAIPAYLMDRKSVNKAKVLSNMIKQKRKEKAGKWQVPLPKVRAIPEAELFKVYKSGKRQSAFFPFLSRLSFPSSHLFTFTVRFLVNRELVQETCDQGHLCRRRLHAQATKVRAFHPSDGTSFQEGARHTPRAQLVCSIVFFSPSVLSVLSHRCLLHHCSRTFCLDIIGVKKNPQSPMYTQLGVITKGTIIEVNVSDLGLVTPGGKVVWGKYAQVTNNPENDGCINAVLLV